MSNAELLDHLRRSVSRGAPIQLASGATSDVYVDGRRVSLDPQGSLLLGRAILAMAQAWGATCVAGPVTGACPLVSAAGVLAAQAGVPLKLVYVRGAPKEHGLGKAIEGASLTPEDRVVLVEDVVTSGGSVLKAAERVAEQAQVLGVWCMVDREAGGRERIEAAGYRFEALATLGDLSPA
ncbi:MAG: orotate phosphoribosyltransferase [Planctomycetes bacterium]|nr:orotate phosphoribosyltransferase [Planctomycetota bacterium]